MCYICYQYQPAGGRFRLGGEELLLVGFAPGIVVTVLALEAEEICCAAALGGVLRGSRTVRSGWTLTGHTRSTA